MSEADKMFEELGYKKYENYAKTREIFIFDGLDKIIFDKEYKYFTTSIINGGADELIKFIKVQELKAINKKCEELRMAMIEEDDEFWEEFIKEQERLIEEEKIMRRIEGD